VKLREFLVRDTQAMIDHLNDVRVTQYITSAIPQPYSQQDAMGWIELAQGDPLIQAIEHDGIIIGCISASVGAFEYNRSAEIGYWLGYSFWNQGLATQAIEQFVERIFKHTDIERIFCSVVSENGASIRVLEKNGFSLDGILVSASFKNGQFFNESLLSKLRT